MTHSFKILDVVKSALFLLHMFSKESKGGFSMFSVLIKKNHNRYFKKYLLLMCQM